MKRKRTTKSKEPDYKAIRALSNNQKLYLEAIDHNDIIFCDGAAGTGKTLLAVSKAIEYLFKKKVQKLIFTRPAISAGEKLGFLPGDLKDKIDPYLAPIYDYLYQIIGNKTDQLIENKIIEIIPVSFIRGRTFKNCIVILDEAQNATPQQMLMFLTRIGKGSKLIVNGDTLQSDIREENGLYRALVCFLQNRVNGIICIEMNETDIQRHHIISQIIKYYTI